MRLHTSDSPRNSSHGHGTTGLILDRGWRYDLEVWFFDTFLMGGAIGRLRRRVVELAGLADGDRLLDIGCGTGSLAVLAARTAGAVEVSGVDPGARQIDRARSKARRAGVRVDFRAGVIEELPFADGSFDAVTSTLMMHHLPEEVRRRGVAEIARVLKPGGRLVVADFDYAEGGHAQDEPSGNGHGGTDALPALLTDAGLSVVETEHVDFKRTHRGWSGATVLVALKV